MFEVSKLHYIYRIRIILIWHLYSLGHPDLATAFYGFFKIYRIADINQRVLTSHFLIKFQLFRFQSAIVPVKNGSAHLSMCLDSILEQVVCPKFVIEV